MGAGSLLRPGNPRTAPLIFSAGNKSGLYFFEHIFHRVPGWSNDHDTDSSMCQISNAVRHHPDSFLRVGVGTVRRSTSWQNEPFDGLVEQARRVTDQKERMALYNRADKLLMEEAPIMPLFYWRQHYLLKPWVSLSISALGKWLMKDGILEPHD